MKNTAIASGIQMGANTRIHGQLIMPHSFKTRKMKNKTVEKVKPLFLLSVSM